MRACWSILLFLGTVSATQPVRAAEDLPEDEQTLKAAKVEISDLAGDNDHFAAIVVSSEFAGKSKLQQHQLVYKALGGAMGGELHALQLQTCVPT